MTKEIKQDYGNLIPVKNIDVYPNRKIKTRVLISDISPGINLLKGYEASCPQCKREEIVYTKNDKITCGELFEGSDCKGPRGGAVYLYLKPINDTGYYCTGYDPEDTGNILQFTSIFFSNKILPKLPKQRDNFETDIQQKTLIIYGKIITLPSAKKVTDWAIDVEKYEFEEKEIKINHELLNKFKDIPRDDKFFQENFVPKIYKRNLSKKTCAISMLSPYRIKLPNNETIFGVINIIEAGDPGQSKTVLGKGVLDYCNDCSNAKLISVENSTNRGIIGSVVRNQTTGNFMVKLGELTLCHKGLVFLDGYGKLSQEDFSQFRGIQEEHEFQITKAGGIKKECVVRINALSNLTDYVTNYPTKHKATYDISATHGGIRGKFVGADRRRYAHVIINSEQDTNHQEIDNHIYKIYDPKKEVQLKIYWNNLRIFAWNLENNNIEWEEDILELSEECVRNLKNNYNKFSLEYGILSKKGLTMFLQQLPAVAILHESIKDNKVLVKEEHVRWLYDLYLEEFMQLGLDLENNIDLFLERHSEKIIEHASNKLIQVLKLIYQYGSQTAVEKAGKMGRVSIWRALNEVIEYEIKYEQGNQKEKVITYYCPNYGSGTIERIESKNKNYIKFNEPDGLLPPLMKSDGTLTNLGHKILKCASKSVKLVQVTPTLATLPKVDFNGKKLADMQTYSKVLEDFEK